MKVSKVERKIEAAKCSRESTDLQPDKVSVVVNFVNFQIQDIHPPGPTREQSGTNKSELLQLFLNQSG